MTPSDRIKQIQAERDCTHADAIDQFLDEWLAPPKPSATKIPAPYDLNAIGKHRRPWGAA
jgi:hypothetical protein